MSPNSTQTGSENSPVVEFAKLIPQGRLPKRADRSGAGSIPGRAMRYCDALTSATGFGHWLFPPMDFRLLWDGDQVFWGFEDDTGWLPLSGTGSGAVQFPGYAAIFDEQAPGAISGYSPPFLTALPELGGVQVWTGLLARTRPGWSLNVRQPVNLPGIAGLTAWEGIIETDHWFGPLFTNFRITKTDFPVMIRAHIPFIQVQPLPQIAYHENILNSMSVRTAEELSESDWSDLQSVIIPSDAKTAAQGTYAVRLRKRRACPFHTEKLLSIVAD